MPRNRYSYGVIMRGERILRSRMRAYPPKPPKPRREESWAEVVVTIVLVLLFFGWLSYC